MVLQPVCLKFINMYTEISKGIKSQRVHFNNPRKDAPHFSTVEVI